jgi:predicted transport protein
MPIFKINKSQLEQINEKKIDLEKDLQKMTEDNLKTIFNLEFISTEFILRNFRIDTFAFDKETNSFVIIEYKRDRSFSVIDQGFAYLSLMLNNKDSFILEYAKKTKIDLDEIKIDWSQSRVLFLANLFTTYQQNAVNFKDLPIELWEVKNYDNNTVLYNLLKSAETSESINKITKNKTIESVSKEVKKRTVDDHFKVDWKDSRKLFENIRERILELDERLEENTNPQPYIGYKIGNFNVVAILPYKSKIIVSLSRTNPKDLEDPKNKAELRKNSMKFYNQDIADIQVISEKDIEYAMFLIKQVYNKLYK